MAKRRVNRRQSPARVRVFLLPFFIAMIMAGMMVGAVWTWRWVQEPTTFPVTHIVVRGDLVHVSTHELRQIIATHLKGGFFSLNLRQVRQAVLTCSWVASVSFRRVWPDTLHATLVEQKPLARFGGVGVLNTDGQVFYPSAKTIPENLPLIEGPLNEATTLADFYENASALLKLLSLSINMLSVDADQNWQLRLSNNVLVRIGREDTLNRFKRFVAVYPKISENAKAPIVSVDLRYPDGMAVRYAGAKTA